jgi:hypothetical protein
MKTVQIAPALLISILLAGSLPSFARTSHSSTEPNSTSVDNQITTPSGKELTKREHRRTAKEKRAEAAEAKSTQESAPAITEEKKPPSLLRLFEPKTSKQATESKQTATSVSSADHQGMVFVHGYTTKTGRKVEGYWRRKPTHS